MNTYDAQGCNNNKCLWDAIEKKRCRIMYSVEQWFLAYMGAGNSKALHSKI